MANYYGLTRSNYFSVTDEAALQKIIDRIVVAECGEKFLYSEVIGGEKKWSFSAYGSLSGFPISDTDDCVEEYDYDAFLHSLQEILVEGDAICITEIGNEKLRYFCAVTIVITTEKIESVDLYPHVLEKACQMLKNENFSTRLDY